ncbi:MAG: hypothetical protein COW13_02260 [Candidatus Omnitrophica bacterium CG12_big_fil_rev_8_21_14_0_65_50_5]|nr:MAG: hypothetical protein COW13_02260 [Candidatus Omnitrophica bacterium CG12_big_fil_rev_8_21_14_0_65_50_5]
MPVKAGTQRLMWLSRFLKDTPPRRSFRWGDSLVKMSIFFDLIYAVIFPFFAISQMIKGKWHEGMRFRLGAIDDVRPKLSDQPRIWIHAVSVGEVLAVADFVRQLSQKYPSHQIVCSTVTRTGFHLASANLKDAALVIYAPVDFSRVVRKFVDVIHPNIYISAETELWPNLYRCLSSRNIPVVLINGRISDTSFANYRRIKFLLQPALRCVNVFAMQTQEDSRRITALGARLSKVHVVGNLKFDTVSFAVDQNPYEHFGKYRVFLAGSTHAGEEDIVLDAFEKMRPRFPDLRLMIAPRHIERVTEIIRRIEAGGRRGARLSEFSGEWDERSVLVIDQMGILRYLYKIAAVVFIGKTFKAGGGQNMIEPLVFGKPVFVGPLTQNFKDVVDIFLRENVLFRVESPEQLAEAMVRVLGDPYSLERIRRKAPEVIRSHQGAVQKLLEIVKKFL